jgi:hypothetical protein
MLMSDILHLSFKLILMKWLPLLVLPLIISNTTIRAQTKEIAQKEFLEAINKVASVAKQQHWAYEDPFTVDSAFHFLGDTLTATFKFKTDSNSYRIRYTAPINQIKGVFHDMYLILTFKSKSVNVYEEMGNTPWQFAEKRMVFHIGLLEFDDKKHMALREEVEWALEELMAYNE